MKSHKLSVIIPVYRGEKFIKKNLKTIKNEIFKIYPCHEIIAVIDGNLDNSYREAKKVKGIKVVGYKKNRGKGGALKYGFEFASGEYITFLDSDMDLPPAQLKNFFPYLETAEFVIGSKRHPFSKLEYPFIRKLLSKGFQLYSHIILGINLRDTQSGLKLMKKSALDVIMPSIMVKRYAFDVELCFLAQKHGFRVVEAPLHINFQKNSGSGINLKQIRGMFFDVLAIRYRYSFLHYYQKKFIEEKFGKK